MMLYRILCRTISIILLVSLQTVECQKVHELMTDGEIMNLFHTTRDKIPKYEIVDIEHSLHKRSTRRKVRINFKAFGRNVSAYLDPIDGILVSENTPVWVAANVAGQTYYRKLKQGIMKEALGVYQDDSNEAALVVKSRHCQDLQFRGTIQDMTIMPLPDHVKHELKKTDKKKRDLSKASRTMARAGCHIVFKSNKGVKQAVAQQSHNSTIEKNKGISMPMSRKKPNAPNKYVVFPTILVTTDYNIAVEWGDDSAYYEQIMYQMAFWNGVDLKFRQLSNPKVRLRIAGIVIGYERSATPYIKRHMYNRKVDGFGALRDMLAYWGQKGWNGQLPPKGTHIAATLTNLKMVDRPYSTRTLRGVAKEASICINQISSDFPSAIITDDLSFGGINDAVHELGHVLGAGDDDSIKCPSSEGHLMSATASRTANNLKWSSCSLERIETTLRSRSCADKPTEHFSLGKRLKRVLPGTLRTSLEQCQARGYDLACPTTPDICKTLKCYDSGFYGFFTTLLMCQDSWSAAEGTECGPESYCIDGECKHS